ncbi:MULTISPECIES: hypothetical protein [Streptomyces]|uniref:hypothetical protein n=1 Tax=Streptomyces TaxID=1883 RepID=UPI00131679A9|nr:MULTISPECIES: hypothetical protein [Streptomyces]QGZ50432.1 hypothetical protein GPZ77_20525 [Streptomyces sp. QHH-9511]GGT88388.1 hypothetical protein GCM10010272_36510 [Streptomyces lateritius]
MAEPTNTEIIQKIAEVKAALVLPQPESGKPPNVSQLKEHLIAVSPHVVTVQWMESTFTAGYFKKIDDMHQELTKAKKTEWLEAMGLDGFAAALEKYHESSGWWPAYLAAAVVGLAVPAIGIYLAGKLLNISRSLQQWGNPDRPIRAYDENGDITRQNRQAVEDRERRVFNGGGLSTIPDAANINGAREALEKLIRQIDAFNRKAGPFRTKFNKMPSARELTKAAKGVEKISTAVDSVNTDTLQTVTTKTRSLKNVMADFAPNRIPQNLKDATRAAEGLDRAGQNLRERFDALKLAATGAATAIGAA